MILCPDPYLEEPDDYLKREHDDAQAYERALYADWYEEEYWTQHEVQEAKQMAYTLGDMMLDNGSTHEEAHAKVTFYLGQVGTIPFDTYKGRIASAATRNIRENK